MYMEANMSTDCIIQHSYEPNSDTNACVKHKKMQPNEIHLWVSLRFDPSITDLDHVTDDYQKERQTQRRSISTCLSIPVLKDLSKAKK